MLVHIETLHLLLTAAKIEKSKTVTIAGYTYPVKQLNALFKTFAKDEELSASILNTYILVINWNYGVMRFYGTKVGV